MSVVVTADMIGLRLQRCPMELGHQFKLLVFRSDIFTESGFNTQQAHDWLTDELLGYGKPAVIVVDGSDLSVLSRMVALVATFPIEPVELAVTRPQSVTFRASEPLTFDGSIWEALAQRHQLQLTDSVMVFNWTGLRGSESHPLEHFIQNGWNQPSQFIRALSNRMSESPD